MDTALINQLSEQISTTWPTLYAVRNNKIFDISDEPVCIWSLADLETISARENEIVLHFQDGTDLVLEEDRWRFT